MTYGELIDKRKKLNSVNFIETANSKFVYAVARNKDKMDSLIKSLNNMRKPSDEYIKYQEELDVVNRKHALKEADGTIAFVTINTPQGIQRGFKKLIGEGNPESVYEKDLSALKARHKEAIKEQEAKERAYEDRLDAEIPADDYRIFFIDADIIPDGQIGRAHV